ncbi:uncharacterized protein [Clytia hemisphaerica]
MKNLFANMALPLSIFIIVVVFRTTFAVPINNTTNEFEVKEPSKKTVESYKIEGCFNTFPDSGKETDMGRESSNARCQRICQDVGYILAATQGSRCLCGNVYPKGHLVNDTECRTKCRSYTQCYNAQSCCGGENAYSVSVVGDIDVAKQVLRRLALLWRTNEAYRNHMQNQYIHEQEQNTQRANWWNSIDNGGWSKCQAGHFLTGVYRSPHVWWDERLGRLEEGECKTAPRELHPMRGEADCYALNLHKKFNNKGWHSCRAGYYISGVYTSPGAGLENLEEFYCCKPKSQGEQWGRCYNHDAHASLDRKGWTKCNAGYFISGLYRNSCERLGCIEELKCCQMGPYNGNSFIDNPSLVIKTKRSSGGYKECSMDAKDETPESESYSCKNIAEPEEALKLRPVSFIVEDKTEPTTAKPERVKDFRPVQCFQSNVKYTCTKSLSVTIAVEKTLTIGTGFDVGLTLGYTAGYDSSFFGQKASVEFSAEVSTSFSFSSERSETKSTETSDSTEVAVEVKPGRQITIDLMRKKIDVVYKWKGTFRLLGTYELKWSNGDNSGHQDVTTVLTGRNRDMYAFGTWEFPDTDMLQVLVTDQFGNEKICEHASGDGANCNIKKLKKPKLQARAKTPKSG